MEEDYRELLQFLKKLGIESLSKSEKKTLLTKLQSATNLSSLERELEVLYSLNKVLIEEYKQVSLANMMRINNDIDNQLLAKLFIVFYQIKYKGLDEVQTLKEFKKTSYEILANNKKANLVMNKLASDTFSKINELKESLYLTMSDIEKADKLFNNCLKRLKTFLKNSDARNLESIILCLKNNFNLTDDEIVDISSRCASVFAYSSAAKINNLNKTLNEFKEFIDKELTKVNAPVSAHNLLNRDFKDILASSASITTLNSEDLEKTIRFLKGERLGNLTSKVDSSVSEIRGKFSSLQLARIYKESITSLATSVETIGNFCSNIAEVYKKHYGEELDLNNLINGNNFPSINQLNKGDYLVNGKIETIFDLLSPFISAKEMEKLLQNNVGFLVAEIKDVKSSLREAILNSKNKDELKHNILKKIRNHFDQNKEKFVEFTAKGVRIGRDGLNKIEFNEVAEDKLADFLREINADDDEINDWKNSWNKEDKERRNSEAEKNLVAVLEQLVSLNEMISDSTTIDTLQEETMIAKNLFIEVLNNYEEIVKNNRMNKSLKEVDEKIIPIMEEITEKINDNFTYIASEYKQSLNGLYKHLSELTKKMDIHSSNEKRIANLEKELIEVGISKEESIELKGKIEKVTSLVDHAKKELNLLKNKEKLENELVKRFMASLEEKDTSTSFKLGIITHTDDRYSNPVYLAKLFLLVLLSEDLIYYDNDLQKCNFDDVLLEDKAMSYDTYRNLLTKKQVLLADRIHKAYKDDTSFKNSLYVDIISLLSELGTSKEELDDICRISDGLSALCKIRNKLESEYNKYQKIVVNRASLIRTNEGIDLESIAKEIESLNEKISEYNEIIDKLEKEKITIR